MEDGGKKIAPTGWACSNLCSILNSQYSIFGRGCAAPCSSVATLLSRKGVRIMNPSSEHNPSEPARNKLLEICRKMDASARLAWTLAICELLLLVGLGLALADYWL